MFKYFITILFLCSHSSNLFAQKRFNPERKYAIVLPDRWKNSPKLLLKITSLVSAFVPELEDKQECLDCGANYWIKFYVSSLQIDDISYRPNQQEFFTYYRFLGFLDVYNQGAGAIQDIMERKSEIVVNKYKEVTPYTTPSA